MKRSSKILVLSTVIVALLIAVAILTVFVLPETDLIRTRVQDELRRVTGHEVALGAMDVKPAFPELFTITVSNVSIISAQGNKLFEAGRVVLAPDPFTAFAGVLTINKVIVEDFRSTAIREEDGTVTNAFVTMARPQTQEPKPVPISRMDVQPQMNSPAAVPRRQETKASEEPSLPSAPTPQAPSAGKSMRWAVRKVELRRGSIEWIDRRVLPGTNVVIPIRAVSGVASQDSAKDPLRYDVSAQVGDEPTSIVKSSGQLTLSPAADRVDAAEVAVSSKALALAPFQPYVPAHLSLFKSLTLAAVKAGVSFDSSTPPVVTYDVTFSTGKDSGVDAHVAGETRFADRFRTLEKVTAALSSDGVPLKLVASHVPPSVPVEPDQGSLTMDVSGSWSPEDHWQVEGDFGLAGGRPTGKLARLGESLDIQAQGRLTPRSLTLRKLAVRDDAQIAEISGTITHPLSDTRELDLSGELAIDPDLLAAARVELPKEAVIEGDIPTRLTLRGTSASMWVDANADLSKATLGWNPFAIKKTPGAGSLRLTGTLKIDPESGGSGADFDATAGLKLGNVRFKIVPTGRPLTDCSVNAQSKIAVRGTAVDLKDIDLKVLGHGADKKLLRLRGNVAIPGNKEPRFTGTVWMNGDGELLKAAGVRLPPGTSLTGRAPITARCEGTPSTLRWGLELPLTGLEVRIKDIFVKKSGVAGALDAKGTWASQALTVSSASLTLPGVRADGEGTVFSPGKGFGAMNITLERTTLESLASYVAALRGVPVSGPVQGVVSLKGTPKGIVHTAAIRLLGLQYQAEGGSAGAGNITGAIQLAGDDVILEGVSGAVRGVVNGPATINGKISGIRNPASLSGNLSLHMGKGEFRPGTMATVVSGARSLVELALDPTKLLQQRNLYAFDSVDGNVGIQSGVATTNNLQVSGPEMSAGVVGSYHLIEQTVDLNVALRTFVASTTAVGKIAPVRKLLESGKALIDNLGLGKELKRFGIQPPDESGQAGSSPQEITKVPVVIMVKVHGPAASPEVRPVLEDGFTEGVLSNLKRLIE